MLENGPDMAVETSAGANNYSVLRSMIVCTHDLRIPVSEIRLGASQVRILVQVMCGGIDTALCHNPLNTVARTPVLPESGR
jgi:hypothetical protein